MTDELFEVAFSGQIREGQNPEDVKARVGKMFNADAAKIAQLFSGNRIVIKKNVDRPTADKYQVALNRAGAECEITSMTATATAAAPAPAAAPPRQAAAPASAAAPDSQPAATSAPRNVDYGDIAPPPQTDPLGITGDQIEDLSASIAPVGSVLQDEIKEAAPPQIDISGFDVAPVGSVLGSGKKNPDPPPPDTSGLSLAD